MGRMLRVNLRHQSNDLFPFVLIRRLSTLLPFVVSRSADSHQVAKLFDIIFPGQLVYDPEFFGLKGI